MQNLIYLSSASYFFTDEDLTDILTVSRKNNTRLGITGLLLYNEGSILQILEGEEEVIKPLYAKISRDERHKNVIKVLTTEITERSFSEWSMGFKQVSNEDWSELNGYLNLNKKAEVNRTAGTATAEVISIIKSFANVNRISLKV